MIERLYNGKPFKRTHRLTRDAPLTPIEKLGEALERCIVACQGRRNTERAQAVLDTIKEQGWAVVPREPTEAMIHAGYEMQCDDWEEDWHLNPEGITPEVYVAKHIWPAMVAAAEQEWTLVPPEERK